MLIDFSLFFYIHFYRRRKKIIWCFYSQSSIHPLKLNVLKCKYAKMSTLWLFSSFMIFLIYMIFSDICLLLWQSAQCFRIFKFIYSAKLLRLIGFGSFIVLFFNFWPDNIELSSINISVQCHTSNDPHLLVYDKLLPIIMIELSWKVALLIISYFLCLMTNDSLFPTTKHPYHSYQKTTMIVTINSNNVQLVGTHKKILWWNKLCDIIIYGNLLMSQLI